MDKKIYDIIVVGAGPTGLFSTFYASYMKLKCLCVELSNNVGGQLINLYPNKYIYDFPGHSKIKAIDLVDVLKEQINMHNGEILLSTSIVEYSYLENEKYFTLYDQNNNKYYAKNIIITIGIGSFEPNKIEEFPESHDHEKVQYFLNSNCDYLEKNIIIFGGGNSAADIAHQLKTEHNANVQIIHHRDELRANSFSINELQLMNINVNLNTKIIDWNPQYCKFIDNLNREFTLFYDYIIVQYGLKPLLSPVHNWDNLLVKNKKIVVNHNYETNIKNIYAAGDCIYSNDRVNSIVSGIAEATIIINKIKNNLNN